MRASLKPCMEKPNFRDKIQAKEKECTHPYLSKNISFYVGQIPHPLL